MEKYTQCKGKISTLPSELKIFQPPASGRGWLGGGMSYHELCAYMFSCLCLYFNMAIRWLYMAEYGRHGCLMGVHIYVFNSHLLR